MLLWFLAVSFFLLSVALLATDPAVRSRHGLSSRHERAVLRHVCGVLQEIEQTFEAGLVPDEGRIARLAGLPAPWGELASRSLEELRSRGGAVLPTLRRLRSFAFEHARLLAEAQARSAQALMQSLACSALVPLTGLTLYWILPGVEPNRVLWAGICLVALTLASIGSLWLLSIAERARWAGLPPARRPWVLSSHCAGERFLSLVRAGEPPDNAWASALELIGREAPELRSSWRASVWQLEAQASASADGSGGGAEGLFIRLGEDVRRAIQSSLIEGRACLERVETLLLGLRSDFGAATERELNLLGTRALKPLFACVAPALLGLLAAGLWLSWSEAYAL